MRLSKIKIAGFKSFVDVTEVLLPSNLIGVVGPNGCGKSNIIDAVRWVMGETSAKMLRGDSMTDVIFSGSASRKPVGMATVELIFDNSSGKIQGEYAAYNEISVKRQVNREAQSLYFLNGKKCRKKDIVDLFLGTGLGPRSYSIIEQGMISKIVESKPEELRGFIEEAAGVSKYRERRRETERRIKRTRENLERLDDLRSEVGKHIQHLQRQAKNAERYQQLKQQQQQLKAEILAMRWQQWNQQAEQGRGQVNGLKTALEQAKAAWTNTEKNIQQQRNQHQDLQQQNNLAQEQLYQINGEIGKIEQAIAHSKALSERQQNELQQIEQNLKQNQQQQTEDQQQLKQQQQAKAAAEPQLEELQLQVEELQESHQQHQQQIEQWQQQWQQNTDLLNEQNRLAQVEQTKIQSLEQQLLRLSDRLQGLQAKQQDDSIEQLQQQLTQLTEQNQQQTDRHRKLEDRLNELKSQQTTFDQQQQQLRNEIEQLQDQLHQDKGRHGSLSALQQAAQAEDNPKLKQWLAQNPHLKKQRLAELISVKSGWEIAVETVLEHRLQALVSEHHDWQQVMQDWQFGSTTVITADQPATTANKHSLAECVTGPAALLDWLGTIKTCQTQQQAEQLASKLKSGESVITPDGQWYGKNWLQLQQGKPQDSFLLRQKQLKSLSKQIEQQQLSLETLQQTRQQLHEDSQNNRQHIEKTQLDINMSHRKLSELNGLMVNKQQQIEQQQQQQAEKTAEAKKIEQHLHNDQAQIKTSRANLEQAMEAMSKLQTEKQQLQQQQSQIQNQYQQSKSQLNEYSNSYHQQQMAVSLIDNKLENLKQGIDRLQQNKQQQQQRKDNLLQQISGDADPQQQRQQQLETLIEQRLQQEQNRDQKRQQVQAAAEQLEQAEQQRQQRQQQVDLAGEQLQQAKLNQQSQQMKAAAFFEQLQEQGYHAAEIIEQLQQDDRLSEDLNAQVEQQEQQAERLSRSIIRLEPVNLAAIDEFEEESKRKAYLDEQNQDLVSALETLEAAISRIDKDTRTLFKETFEAVNSNIKQLFPKLFGGGHAYLELTGNDLLTTGVSIMARPPGKRVSSIQLLSGGEKALTAVSLVFAIFNLNPAPFCMLDEVDAPLDDANVGRFSKMVAEMSEKVQFLFVSHNKVTMEIANQLMGVTMREAGVSRLVSVDLEEAAQMAAD